MKIIPAIDIIDGKCVRLTQGDYSQRKTYNEHPLEVARQFEDAGLSYLHLVDLDGAKNGMITNYKLLEILASKTIVFNLIISLTQTYLFLAFLPTIHLINPGLDASWSYGISQAAKEKLVFGKEIVFTYGPLGYLTQGAALYSNFKQIILFRFAVHFVLLGLLILRIINKLSVTIAMHNNSTHIVD